MPAQASARTHSAVGRGGKVAGNVRRRVASGGVRFWSATDFPDYDPRVVDKALQRLKDAGQLRAVRRGLFYRGRKTGFGMSRPSQNEIVAAVAGTRGVGPAGLTAANELGLTTQMAGTDVYAVPRPAPRDLPSVRFVARPSRLARVKAALKPTEVAVLEVLDAWDTVTDTAPDQTEARLAALLNSGAVRAAQLVRGASDEPPAARERLRHLLARAGHSDLSAAVPPARSDLARRKALTGLPRLPLDGPAR